MSYNTSTFKVSDGLNIYLHKWLPQNENPSKLLFLIHGSVEHAKRYNAFAKKLNKQGFIVIAPDHRGHGLSAKNSGIFSHFGDKDGFLRAVQDLEEILDHIKTEYPTLPRAIFGHSLGSFMTRKLISARGDEFKAAIISGTSWGNIIELRGLILLAGIWSLFTDKNKPNQAFNDFYWSALNAKIKDRKGKTDFISRDENEVRKYEEDELCGVTITIEFGVQMAKSLLMLRKPEVYKNTPKDLNIYLASGTEDPLSNKGKDIRLIADKYRKAGVKNVNIELYPGARHEILNEINREEVVQDIINWLNQNI
ncbi:MAG: alpha/beta hydrolase [Bacteroidales bacterium]|nr:alpha/beta hydrolase [Bacteroidales bacterium]